MTNDLCNRVKPGRNDTVTCGYDNAATTPPEYPAQKGTWTLTAPDGKQWTADSPLRVIRAEINDRVPADVQLQRILAATAPTMTDLMVAAERIGDLPDTTPPPPAGMPLYPMSYTNEGGTVIAQSDYDKLREYAEGLERQVEIANESRNFWQEKVLLLQKQLAEMKAEPKPLWVWRGAGGD